VDVTESVLQPQDLVAVDELAGQLVRVVDALIEQRMPRGDDADAWLSVAEAAARAGCSTRSVHRALASGALVGGRVGRRRRIRASAVDSWVASTGTAEAPALAGVPRTVTTKAPGSPSSFVARAHHRVDS
jgi:excisionase family DNA binding protein